MTKRIPYLGYTDLFIAYDIRIDRLVSAGVFSCYDGAVLYRRYAPDAVFDLAQLNAEASDLDLLVYSAKVFYVAIRQPLRKISRPVQLAFTERIVDELLRSKLRSVQIASSQSVSCYAQLAGDTDPAQLRAI